MNSHARICHSPGHVDMLARQLNEELESRMCTGIEHPDGDWSPDRSWRAIVANAVSPDDMQAIIDAATGILRTRIDLEQIFAALGFTPEGDVLAAGDAQLLADPIAALRLPANHPVYASHALEAPMRQAMRWALDGLEAGDPTDSASLVRAWRFYRAERRYVALAMHFYGMPEKMFERVRPYFVLDDLRPAIQDVFAPAFADLDVHTLDLDTATANRLARALRHHGREPVLGEMLMSWQFVRRAPGFGFKSLEHVTRALLEKMDGWRGDRVRFNPDRTTSVTAAREEAGAALRALGDWFDVTGT